MGEKPTPPKQTPDADGMIEGGRNLVDAFTDAWREGLADDSEDNLNRFFCDPDEPVWGTINKNEVD